MDIINLIIRIIAFAISLIILLEWLVICDVKTSYAFIALIITIIIAICGFFIFKRHNVSICSSCKHIIHN
jgi:hypothetical protein